MLIPTDITMTIDAHKFLIVFAVAALATLIDYLLRIPRPNKTPPGKVSYRVQNIPADWSEDVLRDLLANHFRDCGSITIKSYSQGIEGKSKVCTVLFERLPQLLLEGLKGNINYYSVPPLCLDRAFLSLSVLYSPPSHDHHVE
jgi:hypothetical protein